MRGAARTPYGVANWTAWRFDAPLDVLAQQITAEVSAREWAEQELSISCAEHIPTGAAPRGIRRVVRMLGRIQHPPRAPRALLHHDSVNQMLRLARAPADGATSARHPRQRDYR